jgi:hypothetical protein
VGAELHEVRPRRALGERPRHLARTSGTQGARDGELLHVLMLPDFERADRIGEFWGYPESRAFAELLIDCEEDRTLRAVLVGRLQERDEVLLIRARRDRGASTSLRESCSRRARPTPKP